MKNICVGMALLFFVLFSSSCVISQQGKIQTSTNNHSQNTHSEQSKKVDKTANQEDAEAQFLLGVNYRHGIGVTQDYVKAAEWYRKSADRGNVNAQFNLGGMYYKGEGVTQDYVKAAEWYRKSADRGNVNAQFNLGGMYYKGEGVTQDYTKALKWFSKAAEQGHVFAQIYLGNMYRYGEGVTKDYKKAIYWYTQAAKQRSIIAEQGSALAQAGLGDMHYNGEGVTQDYAKAAEWYCMAAERGFVGAQYSLGLMYYNGQGVSQDYTEAAEWFRKSAEQGYADAQNMLGTMYTFGIGVSQDFSKGVKWPRKAAEQGDDKGQYLLGSAYECGIGVPQDYAKAAEWYRKAADQGNVDAHFGLGKLLEKTDYPGWECLNISDTKYFFINKNKIRQQGNLVWYWTMNVPFQESHSDKKCTKYCYVADCGSARSGLVSYIEYDSNSEVLHSHSFKESEIDMNPVVPGSIGEGQLEYACSHAEAGTYKKEKTAKTGVCFGTGWSVASGFVVTNNHVVEGRNDITLIRPDGVKIPATVAAHDAFNDLALLKVEDVGLLPAALPLSSKPAVLGEKVVTIGYPHPDLSGVKPKLTEGVVNSTSGLGDDPRVLQISVPIQAGNSGGPLLNMGGKVVGIVTSKVDAVKMFKWTGDLPQNINYGIKISYLKGLLSSVSQEQRIDTLAPFKYVSVQGLAKKIRNSVLIIMAE